jgi:hypothetical protein
MAIRLDDNLCTQSDFGIYITKMEFDDYSKDGMEREVKEYLESRFGVNPAEVVYFNPTFDIYDY